jgi:hypothetical protein
VRGPPPGAGALADEPADEPGFVGSDDWTRTVTEARGSIRRSGVKSGVAERPTWQAERRSTPS